LRSLIRGPFTDPRKTALFVLNALGSGKRTLDRIIEEAPIQTAPFSQRDRALLNALVFGVLRWQGRLDWIISHFSKMPLHRIERKVLNILRLGAFQVVYLDRVPDSAAVNTSVELAKSSASSPVSGFVNGVLRSLAGNHRNVPFPNLSDDPVAALSIGKSFPEWMVKRWLDRLGEAEAAAFCDAMNRIPPITLRTNTLRIDRSSLLDAIEGLVDEVHPTPFSPDGIFIAGPGQPIPEMKVFQSGCFQIQDEAAQMVSFLLDPRPGEAVLDACAGLGGKTGHLAQLMKNEGIIVAADRNPEKLERLESEMKRLGALNVRAVRSDLERPYDHGPLRRFDRILLDAPCSGLGVLRRNPDAKWSSSESAIIKSAKRQLRFLKTLSKHVVHGGRLVYAVCSTEPEETVSVVKEFLKLCPEFDIDRGPMPVFTAGLVGPEGYLTTYPHRHLMDGFFAAPLKRNR